MYSPSGAVKMFNFGNENSGFIIFPLIVAKGKMSKTGVFLSRGC